ncbi:hypothetical protein BC936DRAFT_142715, partial [Jimgerdemannia flammicorona]
MIKNLIIAFAVLAASMVNAAPPCSITAPLAGTVWTSGTTATIS